MGTSRRVAVAFSLAGLLACAYPVDGAELFTATTLVSDRPGSGLQDASLVNPWGLSASGSSPFWVADNGTGVATIYAVNPATDATTKNSLTVTIPGAGSVTGQVFNSSAAAGAFNGDNFLFVSEDGTISGWRGALGTSAETLQLASTDNLYKGAAIGSVGGNTYLYAANFQSGRIDVLKGTAGAPDLGATFVDPNLPSGYAPFNVQLLGGQLYVAYAVKDPYSPDEVGGAGLGIVDAFDLNGNLTGRVATAGALNAPWGLALAPSSWGSLAGKLLVGNFGDGTISAYDLATATFVGQLLDGTSNPLAIDGLWALMAGNNGNAGSSDRIYFTAGPNEEANGAFGVIAPVPLPAAASLMAAALAGLVPWLRRRGPPAN